MLRVQLYIQLSEMEEEEEVETKAGNKTPATSEYSSSIELLTLFQRLLLCIIYGHIPSTTGDTGMEPERGALVHGVIYNLRKKLCIEVPYFFHNCIAHPRPINTISGVKYVRSSFLHFLSSLTSPSYPAEQDAQVQGALLVLNKYVTMLHEHVGHIMPTALHVAQISPQHFHRVGAVLLRGPMGVVLPEISLGLVVLQQRMPLLLQARNREEYLSKYEQTIAKLNYDGISPVCPINKLFKLSPNSGQPMCVNGGRLGQTAGWVQPATTFFSQGGRARYGMAWSQEYVFQFQ